MKELYTRNVGAQNCRYRFYQICILVAIHPIQKGKALPDTIRKSPSVS